ncbi:nitroreductase, partial [Sideroxydans sp. CL21]
VAANDRKAARKEYIRGHSCAALRPGVFAGQDQQERHSDTAGSRCACSHRHARGTLGICRGTEQANIEAAIRSCQADIHRGDASPQRPGCPALVRAFCQTRLRHVPRGKHFNHHLCEADEPLRRCRLLAGSRESDAGGLRPWSRQLCHWLCRFGPEYKHGENRARHTRFLHCHCAHHRGGANRRTRRDFKKGTVGSGLEAI